MLYIARFYSKFEYFCLLKIVWWRGDNPLIIFVETLKMKHHENLYHIHKVRVKLNLLLIRFTRYWYLYVLQVIKSSILWMIWKGYLVEVIIGLNYTWSKEYWNVFTMLKTKFAKLISTTMHDLLSLKTTDDPWKALEFHFWKRVATIFIADVATFLKFLFPDSFANCFLLCAILWY